jgi:hypothetical protein
VKADRSCLSYWFPKVQAAGLPVPKTVIVKAPDLSPWLELKRGESLTKGFDGFFNDLARACAEVGGFPVFLRTGHGSGKHEWQDTCFVPNFDVLPEHAYAIFEWSHMVDFLGLPTDVWAVREFLETEPAFHAFDEMPVTKERRYFVRDGEVICRHPYWPEAAFEGRSFPSREDWREKLAVMNSESPEEVEELTALSRRAAAAVPGFWSVDWLRTKNRGWVLIDMAEGERSFHWDGCPNGDKGDPA